MLGPNCGATCAPAGIFVSENIFMLTFSLTIFGCLCPVTDQLFTCGYFVLLISDHEDWCFAMFKTVAKVCWEN